MQYYECAGRNMLTKSYRAFFKSILFSFNILFLLLREHVYVICEIYIFVNCFDLTIICATSYRIVIIRSYDQKTLSPHTTAYQHHRVFIDKLVVIVITLNGWRIELVAVCNPLILTQAHMAFIAHIGCRGWWHPNLCVAVAVNFNSKLSSRCIDNFELMSHFLLHYACIRNRRGWPKTLIWIICRAG